MEYKALRVTVVDKLDWDGHPAGQLVHLKDMQGKPADWMMGCPACETPLTLQHDVLVLEGKATITPSIVCTVCGAHFTVTGGVVQPD